MALKFLVEENVTDGLDALQVRVSENMEHILNEMADVATGKLNTDDAPIPEGMSLDFNPFLFSSGQMDKNRHAKIEKDQSILDVVYTGMDLQHDFIGLGSYARVWREFARDEDAGMPPTERTLVRDYAYYQETGIDKLAKPKGAKHQHAIRNGLSEARERMGEKGAKEFKKMLEK